MKKTIIMALVALICCNAEINAQGFLKRLGEAAKNAAKNAVENNVTNKTREKVDDIMNGKKSDSNNSDADANVDVDDTQADATIANQKSDFVPGSVVVFEDAVKGEQVGEFPSKWDLERGNAEIAVVDGAQAIELNKEDCWIKPLISKNPKNYLGDEFTVEFDVMYTEGSFEFDFMTPDQQRDGDFFTITTNHYSDLSLGYTRTDGERGHSDSNAKNIANNRWHHYAISFNKRAIKVYVDNVRYISVPNAKAGAGWMTIFYRGEKPAYMKNVRIARGAGELYGRNATDASEAAIAKAIESTGKFVTNNILFETGKANLKSESMAEIQKVAAYMKANPSVRFEVQGHTDNQGSDAINDPLSQKRAEAIVKALEGMGVDGFNLKAVGKGSHEPVADNKSEAGRAQNRRVEFIKR